METFTVYSLSPDGENMGRRLVGAFAVDGPAIKVLEDHTGMLDSIVRKYTDSDQFVKALKRSSYLDVVSDKDVDEGLRPDLARTVDAPEPAPGSAPEQPLRPPPIFNYQHSTMSTPATLHIENGRMYLNDRLLDDQEKSSILASLSLRRATLRYKDAVPIRIAKMEQVLAKIDPSDHEVLGNIRQAEKAGAMPQGTSTKLGKRLFVDRMVPGVGNKYAYEDFLSRPRPGVHIRLDGNDFGQVNKQFGHSIGDKAITAMGGAMREAMDESVGRGNGKLYRIGGDEFHAHVPSHQHAAVFARALHQKLSALPAIGGTFQPSVSMGMGTTPDDSDYSLLHAKRAKKLVNAPVGQALTHAHSLVPGFEGHIPVSENAMPLPPKPAVPTA